MQLEDGAQDEELLLDDPIEDGDDQEQEPSPEANDELVIEIEGEEAAEEAPLVKRLRAEIRDRDRRLAEQNRANDDDIVVGDYPQLEDFDFDPDKHRDAVLAWTERRRKADEAQSRRASATEAQQREYNDLQVKYQSSLAAIPAKPEEKAAADRAVRDALPEAVQIAIAKYTDDPGKIVLALGRYPAKLSAIADEPDPIKQLKAIWAMEGQIKMTNRRAAPAPEAETIQRGSAPIAAGKDKQLEALEKEAAKTGDRSKLIAYKRQKKAA